MKNLIKYLFAALLLSFTLSGCYTVIWSPEDEFPASYENYDEYYGGFYPSVYMGYYDIPWWYNITPPTRTGPYERGESTESIRNNDGGRPSSNPRNGDIINTPPPTKSGSSGNTNTAPEKRAGTENSGSTQRGNSSDSGNVRNNDGNRNSGGRR